MSHISIVQLRILNLAALKQAVKELGCEWMEGQQTYRWYGRFVGDSPMPEGMTQEELGKCSHAIRVPGVKYEIGVVKRKDGSYTLAYDFYGDGISHDGNKLREKFGDGLEKLKQHYAVSAATLAAKAKGWMCQRTTLPNGSIKLVMSGV